VNRSLYFAETGVRERREMREKRECGEGEIKEPPVSL